MRSPSWAIKGKKSSPRCLLKYGGSSSSIFLCSSSVIRPMSSFKYFILMSTSSETWFLSASLYFMILSGPFKVNIDIDKKFNLIYLLMKILECFPYTAYLCKGQSGFPSVQNYPRHHQYSMQYFRRRLWKHHKIFLYFLIR